MKIAIASGKGGTGKTSLATSLAFAAGENTCLLDCDVEEPNSQIFMQAEIEKEEQVFMPVPVLDADKCTGCGVCADFCQFNAITTLGPGNTLIFPELCHSCGGCVRFCPEGALSEVDREIGRLSRGKRDGIHFVEGRMTVGQTLAPPVIRAVLKAAPESPLTLIDAPPGTACPMVATVRECDFGLLVTEPTPFGLHDLELAVETFRQLEKPFAVVINRDTGEDSRVQDYCEREGIQGAGTIPEDRRAAEGYSRGDCLYKAMPEWRERIEAILEVARMQGGKERV